MPKIISIVLAAVLTMAAAGLWLKSSVSETSASFRPMSVSGGLSVYDTRLKAGLALLPEQKIDDKSFIFTDND
jgi:hypothetical protein